MYKLKEMVIVKILYQQNFNLSFLCLPNWKRIKTNLKNIKHLLKYVFVFKLHCILIPYVVK